MSCSHTIFIYAEVVIQGHLATTSYLKIGYKLKYKYILGLCRKKSSMKNFSNKTNMC